METACLRIVSVNSSTYCSSKSDPLQRADASMPQFRRRALTQAALAEKAGANHATVAETETDRKLGSTVTMPARAGALDMMLDNLTG